MNQPSNAPVRPLSAPDVPDASGTTPAQHARHRTALHIAGIEGVEVFSGLLLDEQNQQDELDRHDSKTAASVPATPAHPR